MVTHAKPKAFYDVFTRKGEPRKVTHYCPGCGHGTAHKLIAELIDELGIQDRTILCSPVGCSVFAYYYFDVGNVQCAHGRAPAVATGLRRALPEAVVISYQGDGDLAGIGLAEIVHAANRGENLTVFFINNAIYGMTGGQMAPTTLQGQVTATTPFGRGLSDGAPLGMAELISSLASPVYVERVSLAGGPRILRARRAFKKALQNQIEGRGFSFVEVLSACPVNWKMSPIQARAWIVETLEKAYPVKVFRDEDSSPAAGAGAAGGTAVPGAPPRSVGEADLRSLFLVDKDIAVVGRQGKVQDQQVRIAGFGGQGVMSAGILLANCAVAEELHATWLPSYGPEMRGGTANASVVISEEPVGSPVVATPDTLIAMNGPSFDHFIESVAPGGLVIANSSLFEPKTFRTDVRIVSVPAAEIASGLGFIGAANVVALAAYIGLTGVIRPDTLRQVVPLAIKKKQYVEVNLRAVDAGVAHVGKA
jgi:2-oxoisovalerate ferredoxin oxidoreductase beta subunit